MQPTIVLPRRQNRALIPLCIGLFVAGGPAQAICVDTAQKLQNALTAASDGGAHSGENNLIAVVQGTYKTTDIPGGQPFHYASSSATGLLQIVGGYTAGCYGLLPNAAASTVLDGNLTTQVMTLTSAQTLIAVTGLTLQNGETSSQGAGLAINAARTILNGKISVSATIIRNNHTTTTGGGVYIHSGYSQNSTQFENNLITGNQADQDLGAGILISDGSAEIYQNTIYDNTTAANGTGGLELTGAGSFVVVNNIFRNNTHIGLNLDTSKTDLYYNDYGTLGGIAPQQNVGALMVSPKFVDVAGGDYHLASGSPLLGISPQLTDTLDLDGHLSPAGGKMDLGAYEETIFIDGFDGN